MPNLTFGGAGFEDVDVVVSSPDRPPVVSVADAQVAEGAGAATLTITADITSTSDVIVSYATADGTATSTLDYAATSTTATIAAGTTSTNISIAIVDDTLSEADETFSVILTGATNGTVSAFNGSSTVTIIDDDAVAVTKLNPAIDTDAVAVAEVIVRHLKEPTGGTTSTPSGISAFDAILTYDTTNLEVLDVRPATEFAGSTSFNTTSTPGQLTISATLASGQSAIATVDAVLVKVVVRLIGSANTTTDLTLTSLDITDGGSPVGEETEVSNTYQRADTTGNGAVSIGDALFIAQCLVGLRDIGAGSGECHPINGG